MPIFYAISHRRAGLGGEEIDASPDSTARADAVRVLNARPAVIIYYRWPPEYFHLQEAL